MASNKNNVNLYFTSLKKKLRRTNVPFCPILVEIPIQWECRQEIEINLYKTFQSHWTSFYHKHLLQLLKKYLILSVSWSSHGGSICPFDLNFNAIVLRVLNYKEKKRFLLFLFINRSNARGKLLVIIFVAIMLAQTQ